MRSTQDRKKTLQQIIRSQRVFSQEELQLKLREHGIETTQATLSRDLKALHIVKVPGEGYRLPSGNAAYPESTGQGILSIEFSGQSAVIKTLPGFAPATAAHIDRKPIAPIMGTLAGDDTVLLILRQGYSTADTLEALELHFPQIKQQLIG